MPNTVLLDKICPLAARRDVLSIPPVAGMALWGGLLHLENGMNLSYLAKRQGGADRTAGARLRRLQLFTHKGRAAAGSGREEKGIYAELHNESRRQPRPAARPIP